VYQQKVPLSQKTTFLGSSTCTDTYEYVVVSLNLNTWPLSKQEVSNIVVELLHSRKYTLLFSERGTRVLVRNEVID